MPRIAPVARGQSDAATNATLDTVKAGVGMVPNLYATLARAPAALNAYLAYAGALDNGRLSVGQKEIIALAVGQAHACQYCLAAHTLLGKNAGLSESAILNARAGKSAHPLEDALAALAVKIARQRGVLSDADLASARAAGIDDGLIIEIVANVVLNILSNYTNHIADTDVDFPMAKVNL